MRRDMDVEQGWEESQRGPPPPLPVHDDERRPSLLTLLGFAFLTFNYGMAIYRSQGDLESVAFAAFSYLDVVLLFYCLIGQVRDPNSWRVWGVRASVWALTVLLAVMFGYRVATIMPLPMAAVVWAMAAAALVGIFYAFFAQPGTAARAAGRPPTAHS